MVPKACHSICKFLMLDILNPAIYALGLATIMFVLVRNGRHVRAVILPMLAGVLDYAENLTLFLMATRYPDISDGLVGVSSALSMIKHLTLGIAVAAFVAAIVMWFRSRRASRGDAAPR